MKSIQRGMRLKNIGENSLKIPINTIDPTKSLCHLYLSGYNYDKFDNIPFILNSNSIDIPYLGEHNSKFNFTWQVIEYA